MNHIPYSPAVISAEESSKKSAAFYAQMNTRRSVRFFSDTPVSKDIIENILRTAGTAPSGAHKQPWHFCAIRNPALKSEIRAAAEVEEKNFYSGKAPEKWLEDLAPLGTDWHKPFLEIAPWIVVVFKRAYDESPEGKAKNYYVQESVGIACGMLISAIHDAGLATLTHTPSPMNFLSEILQRPENEKPYLLLPVGYPAADATVPDLVRKSLQETTTFFE